ncbi:MAG TPA: PilW family protein [Ramlibacter sp.]|nr:PilW family protein [Ramlibacter sp.]
MQRQSGFTLVELMIGVLIGLIATLAVTQVLVSAEGQKRTTTSGSDAQVNGALALDMLQRAVQPAGYGFGAIPALLGCPILAKFNNVAVAGFPAVLAPVTITAGAVGASDTLRVFGSGKPSQSVPIRITAPYNSATGTFPVAGAISVNGPQNDDSGTLAAPGELMLATIDASANCEVFQVAVAPAADDSIARGSGTNWNASALTQAYADGNFLVNLGVPIDKRFSVVNNSLRQDVLQIAPDGTPTYSGATELFPNIVNFKALYGKDTNADGTVDGWDTATPTTNAGWRQVIAVRVAIVARSAQLEERSTYKESGEVTLANPDWDIGTAVPVTGWWTACNAGKCPLRVDTLPDWQKYRYKVFETTVPLRNMLWNS